MGHDVFISHSSKDKLAADAVCAALERAGVRCWVAPRDILPGANWATSINKAIAESRMMVLIFSRYAQGSPHIRREVERAVHRGIPIAPIRIEDVLPADDLEYFLSSSHWMDAMTPPFEQHLGTMCRQVRGLLEVAGQGTGTAAGGGTAPPAPAPPPATTPPAAMVPAVVAPAAAPPWLKGRGRAAAVLAALLLLAAVGTAAWPAARNRVAGLFSREPDSQPAGAQPATAAAPAAGATLADVVAAAGDAERAWDRVRGIDRGQGFGALLDKADGVRRSADKFLQVKAYAEARATYQDLLKQSEALVALDAQRSQAVAARDSIAAAAQAARDAGADRNPEPSWWSAARRSGESAQAAFDRGDFPAARTLWQATAEQYGKGRLFAEALTRATAAKFAYDRALERYDHFRLETYGGQAWAKVQSELNSAPPPSRDPAGAAAAYERAAAALPEAAREAERGYAAKVEPNRPRMVVNTLGMTFVPIKAGTFLMGSPAREKGRDNDETQHRVRITKPFLMAAHEVTRGQFAAFVKDSGYRTDAEKEGFAFVWTGAKFEKKQGASWRDVGFEQADDHPVVNVSWNDAVAFCEWLGKKEGKRYRLPTEAEWEYACRAGTTTAYPWGDDPDDGEGWANAADLTAKKQFPGWTTFNWEDGYVFTSPVGTFKPNAWGLYDMIGNAWQWCADWYADYPPGDAENPTGPANPPAAGKAWRVLRGGTWSNGPRNCRAASRRWSGPGVRSYDIGFRLCLES